MEHVCLAIRKGFNMASNNIFVARLGRDVKKGDYKVVEKKAGLLGCKGCDGGTAFSRQPVGSGVSQRFILSHTAEHCGHQDNKCLCPAM